MSPFSACCIWHTPAELGVDAIKMVLRIERFSPTQPLRDHYRVDLLTHNDWQINLP